MAQTRGEEQRNTAQTWVTRRPIASCAVAPGEPAMAAGGQVSENAGPRPSLPLGLPATLRII